MQTRGAHCSPARHHAVLAAARRGPTAATHRAPGWPLRECRPVAMSWARGSRVNDALSRDAGRLRRQLVALAIEQAMASQWPQAIETNLYLINASGRDVEACNRLGKAYAQLGRIFAAREAYTATL